MRVGWSKEASSNAAISNDCGIIRKRNCYQRFVLLQESARVPRQFGELSQLQNSFRRSHQ